MKYQVRTSERSPIFVPPSPFSISLNFTDTTTIYAAAQRLINKPAGGAIQSFAISPQEMTLKTHLFANDGEMSQLFFGANQDAQLSDLISMEGEVDGTFQIEVPSTTFSLTQSEYTYCIWWHRTGPLLMASNSLPLTWKHPLDRIVNAQPVLKFYIAIGSVKRGEDPTSLVSAMFPQCVMPIGTQNVFVVRTRDSIWTVNGQRSTVNGKIQT